MRLLHATEPRFEDFFDDSIPEYAILSHRWEAHEASYQELLEIVRPSPANIILGITAGSLDDPQYTKIQMCRAKAVEKGLQWVWIDTCCINKESSAELSEAINSMYRWYELATVCFVYLSDVRMRNGRELDVEAQDLENFVQSKWFMRGWTLQELLAPGPRVMFYDSDWIYFGNKVDFPEAIAARTRVRAEYITGEKPILSASVAERMSWVSRRSTSRLEDMAYCMMGIFDINMPLLYGEGKKAFMRLQLEIVRKYNDESIFAWRRSTERNLLDWEKRQVGYYLHLVPENERERLIKAISSNSLVRDEQLSATLRGVNRRQKDILRSFALHSGLLAHDPTDFADSGHIKSPLSTGIFTRRLPYSMTNQGLQFYIDISPTRTVLDSFPTEGVLIDLALNCYEDDTSGPIVISLVKENPKYRKPALSIDATATVACNSRLYCCSCMQQLHATGLYLRVSRLGNPPWC